MFERAGNNNKSAKLSGGIDKSAGARFDSSRSTTPQSRGRMHVTK